MITEPTTTITDYLLSIAGTIFAIQTFRMRGSHPAIILWFLAFSFGAAAALLGGTYHGFKLSMNPGTAKSLWDSTMILIGACAGFLTAAAIFSSLGRSELEYVGWLRGGLLISAAGFVVQKVGWDIHPNFNHNDIYHLIQIAGFWCLYEGVKRMSG
jgi:hypothetical protein